MENIMNKARVHTAYKLKDGTVAPSVTTIISELAKPALIHWAWELGTKGLDYRTFRDELADVGSLTHKMILDYFKKEKTDISDYSKNQIDLAENCFLKFLEWEGKHKVEPVLIETPLVSEKLRYGGTADFFGLVDDRPTLIDFKTGKGIYDEYWYQLSAYNQLLLEANYKPEIFIILNIGRAETEIFAEEIKTDLSRHFTIFLRCLDIYYLKKELKRGER